MKNIVSTLLLLIIYQVGFAKNEIVYNVAGALFYEDHVRIPIIVITDGSEDVVSATFTVKFNNDKCQFLSVTDFTDDKITVTTNLDQINQISFTSNISGSGNRYFSGEEFCAINMRLEDYNIYSLILTPNTTIINGSKVNATASVSSPKINEVNNISELKGKNLFGAIYRLPNEVILNWKSTDNGSKYIEDATGGLTIYDPTGIITTNYNVGDGITGFTGRLRNNHGMLELIPTEDPGAASSIGNALSPQPLSIPELNSDFESYESELITLEGAIFEAAGSAFGSNTDYTITVNGQTMICRIHFSDTDLIGTKIPTIANITGIAYEYDGVIKILPRNLSDLEIQANLTTHIPSGWTAPVVVSKNTGTNTDDNDLMDTDALYIDYAMINNGEVNIAGTVSYALYLNGQLLNTSIASVPGLASNEWVKQIDYAISPLSAGTYTLKLVVDYLDAITELVEKDNEFVKTIDILPSCPEVGAAGIITGATSVCPGTDKTYLIPEITDATAYVWTLPDGTSHTTNTNSITISIATDATDGNLEVYGENQCGEYGLSSSLNITVKETVTPNLKLKWDDVIICLNPGNKIESYQWYKDGQLLTEESGQYIVAGSPGDYSVQITSTNGCSFESDKITTSAEQKQLSLYPNPAKESFTVTLNNEEEGTVNINIYNAAGYRVNSVSTLKSSFESSTYVPAGQLQPGIYQVEIIMNDYKSYNKIIITK